MRPARRGFLNKHPIRLALDSLEEWVENSTEAKVDIRWAYITRAGIRQESEVSIEMDGRSVEEILNTIVSQFARKPKMLWWTDGNTIVLTSEIDSPPVK